MPGGYDYTEPPHQPRGMLYIPQQGSHDCAVASLAMVLRATYDGVMKLLHESHPVKLDELGAAYDLVYEVLRQFSKAVQPLRRCNQLGKLNKDGWYPIRKVWPPKPWAPAHLVQVPRHWLAMDADGAVFDPGRGPEPKRLADYEQVDLVVGVFDVGLM